MEEALEFFKKLYTSNNGDVIGFNRVEWAPTPASLAEWLVRPFEFFEVKEAVFICDGNKALGLDGYTMKFFQQNWDVLCNDIMKVFQEFHHNGIINRATNEKYVCLIPKKINSCKISDFRPISLVTSLYKIISKVFSLRLKNVLEDTISEVQSTFIEGRQILEIALIANELVENYRVAGKQGGGL